MITFKVVCIDNINNNGLFHALTLHAIYKAEPFYSHSYIIHNDKGYRDIYSSSKFKTVKEIRKERIQKLI